MPGIVRRWTSDPGNTVLSQIEGVDIIDNTPPQQVIGAGAGMACIVGEFENGPFNLTTQITSYIQQKATFGGVGLQVYGNSVGQNPCARQRFADGAVLAEYWNGNGSIQLNGKAYAGLCCVRVNTSVGAVSFTRQANLRWGQAVSLRPDVRADPQRRGRRLRPHGRDVHRGGRDRHVGLPDLHEHHRRDDADLPDRPAAVRSFAWQVFQATDTSQAAVISRINAFAGFAVATVVSGSTIKLTGIQRRARAGEVAITGGTSIGSTILNFTVATTAGTGNVANIAAVAPAEINTVVHTAITTVFVELLPTGQLRMYRTSNVPSADSLQVAVASTATNLGFTGRG